MRFSKYKDIYFIENNLDNKKIIKHINININKFFGQSQLNSLSDVKEKMYNIVKSNNGNAIINFKYGQKSTFWKSLIGLDNVYWYGNGDIIFLNNDELNDIENIKNK